jgi:hypothetical protein
VIFLKGFSNSSTNPNIHDCVYERLLLTQINLVHTITGNQLLTSTLILSHSPLTSGFVVKLPSSGYSFYLKMDQHVSPKCWYLSTKLNGVISKKTMIIIVIAVETSNITKLRCLREKFFKRIFNRNSDEKGEVVPTQSMKTNKGVGV